MYNAYDENLYKTLSTHERHLHVVFLSNEKDANDNYLPRRMIADITHYAITTVRTYEKYYEDLLEEARKIFYGIKKLIKGIVDKVKKQYEVGTELCYLCKFYNSKGEKVFSKIGTTTRLIETRMKEHLSYYSNLDIIGVEIESVINCGAYPAEGLESYCRAYYIKKYPNAFKKNDRFFNVDLNTEEFNNLATTYLA